MPSIILDIDKVDTSGIKLLKRDLNRIKKEAMRETAEWFLKTRIAAHFGPANRSRYGHAPRNKVYANEIKKRKGRGQGKFVDNTLTGKSARSARYLSRITATSKQATLSVTVPTYFKRPFVGTYMKNVTGRDGRTRQVVKRITQQPDKVKELLTLDERDKKDTRDYAAKRVLRGIRSIRSEQRTKIKG